LDEVGEHGGQMTAKPGGDAAAEPSVVPEGRTSCRDCGGAMAPGQIVLPLLGSPKFGVKLASMTVESDIASAVCSRCGHVEMWVTDPAKIRWALEAGERAKAAMEHRGHRPGRDNAGRPGRP
jgi:hypothetical protein